MTARTLNELLEGWVTDVGPAAMAEAEQRRVEAAAEARAEAERPTAEPSLCQQLNAIARPSPRVDHYARVRSEPPSDVGVLPAPAPGPIIRRPRGRR